jgi:hypothetical protein
MEGQGDRLTHSAQVHAQRRPGRFTHLLQPGQHLPHHPLLLIIRIETASKLDGLVIVHPFHGVDRFGLDAVLWPVMVDMTDLMLAALHLDAAQRLQRATSL